ncbi:MAG: ABC transporter [Verrucomicrobiaceae bacterium]|nr:MAG: ABC transporter [Verrucomicrobiaceae bacterium]
MQRDPRSRIWLLLLTLLFVLALASPSGAAQIGDVIETDAGQQAYRFLSLTDESVRYALLGSILLGVSCGLLGSFLVVRKMALVGDALSHAVLPGVALGFLWNMSKDPVAIFIGATAAGLLGTMAVGWITRTTKLKEDTALGLILATFFAVGICLLTMFQRLPTGSKSGIDKFLFGQAAAIGSGDLMLMATTTGLSAILLTLFYKEFLVVSFDAVFARTIGLPVRILQETLMLLLAFAVVVALQAVGVVLVSAMLITPAAAAYLLTDRMHRMLWLSAVFGLLAGALGAFLSFLGNNLPTGPFMVLGASAIFALAFLFGPRHGVVPRWMRHRSRRHRIERENTLKSLYHVLENRGFSNEAITIEEFATRRRATLEEAREQIAALEHHGLASFDTPRGTAHLTPEGWRQASAVVRNHRLWELYLTNTANFQADHVHDDAEQIEHMLGEETVRQLERLLNFPVRDPHGKPIPGVHQSSTRERQPPEPRGYGGT